MSSHPSSSKRPFPGDVNSLDGAPPKTPKLAGLFTKQSVPFKEVQMPAGCWHGVWGEPKGSDKVLALDLDGTVITTAKGGKFPKDETDWKWQNGRVVEKIRKACEDGYAIVFISNQAGSSKTQDKFKLKVPLIGRKLNVPFRCFAALGYDQFRKPGTGMWDAYAESFNEGIVIDCTKSLYVGDAAGRPANPQAGTHKDHSDTDRKMAVNAGLPFRTPEEFFLEMPIDTRWSFSGWDPRTYNHSVALYTPTSAPIVPHPSSEFSPRTTEVVIFVGYPASGKTTFFERHFAPAGYVHVNQDKLKTRPACLALVKSSLAAFPPRSVVVDNTSPAKATRKQYVDLIRNEFPGTKIRVIHFAASLELAKHNSVYRALYDPEAGRTALPAVAFSSYAKNLELPTTAEGFDVVQVNFKFEGDAKALEKWQRWLDCYPKPSYRR